MALVIVSIAAKTLITAGVAKYLRIYLETPARLPQWDMPIKYAWAGTLVLMFLGEILSWDFINNSFFYLLFLGALYVIYQVRDFRSARMLMIAVLPYFIVSILKDGLNLLSPDLDKSLSSLFTVGETFSLLWMAGFGIYAQKQNKQEKIQRLKEEEEKKTLEAKRKELEHQVAERTAELTNQKKELEIALDQLRATQAQLIQSEKLASLGELTAGIAHEIQNPLNFVNNFSELSVDLVKDLKEELKKPEKDDVYINELFDDLSQNQEKISHHGKRASNIVKGMLEHSRTSTGVKEMSDINKLADEYLRLTYHGLRAKDKSFNADFTTDFDENLPKIKVIPQDLGRVFLNLINNAFYAVNERANQIRSGNFESFQNVKAGQTYTPSTPSSWSPTVCVTTEQLKNQILIKVKDNGTGMPENVRSKIFQPFFTTKPTGQGTGLGLSLAYDIVTKGHGGTLEVESTEGVGTEFIIKLPI